jgi:uncharacterized protein YdbL (DUF1318 family)
MRRHLIVAMLTLAVIGTIVTTSLAQAATIGLVGEAKKAATAPIAISGDNIYIA